MATYKGHEVPKPDQSDEDLKLAGRRHRGLENVEEELNLPEQAGPDYVPKPGQKGYMKTKPQADSGKPYYGEKIFKGGRDMPSLPQPTPKPDSIKDMKPFQQYAPKHKIPLLDEWELLGLPGSQMLHSKGGPVKHGSPTRVSCRTKHG